MMDIGATDLALSILVITFGAILQASTGLGAGLVIVPLLGLISLELVPGPVILASVALSALMAWRGRDSIDFPHMKIVVAGLLIGTVLGTLALYSIPLDHAGVLLGILVLLAIAITAAGKHIRFNLPNMLAAGTLSGFMGVTAAIGAPVLALLYQHTSGRTLRATLGFLYLLSSLMMLVFLHLAGHFGGKELRLGLYLVPGFLAGYVLAAPIARMLDRGHTRIAVLSISTAGAVLLIARSLW